MHFDFQDMPLLVLALLSFGGLLFASSSLKWYLTSRVRVTSISHMFLLSGLTLLIIYTVLLWLELGRAPMRTMGETRLWYALFALLVSYVVYIKWRYKVIIIGGVFFALMFISINLLNPDLMNKNLPPALQSAWFIPHVSVYMLAYSILGMSCLTALVALWTNQAQKYISIADNLVYIGFAFLTLGMTFGALWAKEAWGHYWAWDPKETWAMITWLSYMLYIHYRLGAKQKDKVALWLLLLAFVLLMVCWLGLNSLSSAQGSLHSY